METVSLFSSCKMIPIKHYILIEWILYPCSQVVKWFICKMIHSITSIDNICSWPPVTANFVDSTNSSFQCSTLCNQLMLGNFIINVLLRWYLYFLLICKSTVYWVHLSKRFLFPFLWKNHMQSKITLCCGTAHIGDISEVFGQVLVVFYFPISQSILLLILLVISLP